MLYSNSMKPVALPPGRARVSTKPAPTGSPTVTNTIGTARVTCSSGPVAELVNVGRKRDQFRRVSPNAFGIARTPAQVDANVAPIGPAQLRERLRKHEDPGLLYRIVRRKQCKHADAPHSLRLLRMRRERAGGH